MQNTRELVFFAAKLFIRGFVFLLRKTGKNLICDLRLQNPKFCISDLDRNLGLYKCKSHSSEVRKSLSEAQKEATQTVNSCNEGQTTPEIQYFWNQLPGLLMTTLLDNNQSHTYVRPTYTSKPGSWFNIWYDLTPEVRETIHW